MIPLSIEFCYVLDTFLVLVDMHNFMVIYIESYEYVESWRKLKKDINSIWRRGQPKQICWIRHLLFKFWYYHPFNGTQCTMNHDLHVFQQICMCYIYETNETKGTQNQL